MILGFVIGVTVETSGCEETAWWNPVSAWRALRNAETNPLLLVFAPESSEHARIAAGSMITGALGLLPGHGRPETSTLRYY